MFYELIALIRQLLGVFLNVGIEVEARKIIAAAADYAVGDVVSESATIGTAWKFENCARAPGRPFYINSIQVTCSEDSITVMSLRIHWFLRNPSASELRDNVALAFVEADRLAYRSSNDLPVFADVGGFSGAGDDTVRKLVIPDPGSRDLYAIVETRGAETNESANMVMTITLGIEQLP